jgi:hypothetical protein
MTEVQEEIVTPVTVPEMSAEEKAAMKFTRLLPYVKKLSSAIPSQKGLIRVLTAFAEFPLAATPPRLLTEAERQLFHVISELQGYKSTVIQSILKKQYELENLKQQAMAPVEVTPDNSGVGVNNGSSENQV